MKIFQPVFFVRENVQDLSLVYFELHCLLIEILLFAKAQSKEYIFLSIVSARFCKPKTDDKRTTHLPTHQLNQTSQLHTNSLILSSTRLHSEIFHIRLHIAAVILLKNILNDILHCILHRLRHALRQLSLLVKNGLS